MKPVTEDKTRKMPDIEKEKRPYEKPAFSSEELFEINALICTCSTGIVLLTIL